MDKVDVFHAVTPVVLIVLGIVAYVLAGHNANHDVLTAEISAGTLLVGGGLTMLTVKGSSQSS